jgi:orotate phosphoribosyltransferase
MDLDELAHRIDQTCRLTGEFLLRSGQTSTTYFDKYQFEGDPELLAAVAELAAPLIPPGTEVLAGLELGGVPIATALSLATGLPAAFVRKEAKTYGTARLAEGAAIEGRRCLVVEDVITTGGQVVLSTGDLRDRGAVVDTVLCVIDRSGGDHAALDAIGLTISSLVTAADLDRAHAAAT